MQAPLPSTPEGVRFTASRIRCACGVESVFVAPAPWYRGQGSLPVEGTCAPCGRPLGSVPIAVGAVHELWVLPELPASRAKAVSAELLDEVRALRPADPPEPERPMVASFWCLPHEASAAYAMWAAHQPAPAAPQAWLTREDLVVTGLLAAGVLLCVVV